MKRIQILQCSFILLFLPNLIAYPENYQNQMKIIRTSNNISTTVTRIPRVTLKLASETGMLNRIEIQNSTTPMTPTFFSITNANKNTNVKIEPGPLIDSNINLHFDSVQISSTSTPSKILISSLNPGSQLSVFPSFTETSQPNYQEQSQQILPFIHTYTTTTQDPNSHHFLDFVNSQENFHSQRQNKLKQQQPRKSQQDILLGNSNSKYDWQKQFNINIPQTQIHTATTATTTINPESEFNKYEIESLSLESKPSNLYLEPLSNQLKNHRKSHQHEINKNDDLLRNVRRNSFDIISYDNDNDDDLIAEKLEKVAEQKKQQNYIDHNEQQQQQQEQKFDDFNPYERYTQYTEDDFENLADTEDDHSKYFVKTKIKDRSINTFNSPAIDISASNSNLQQVQKTSFIPTYITSTENPTISSTNTETQQSQSPQSLTVFDSYSPQSKKIQHSEHSHSYSSYSNSASPLKYFDFSTSTNSPLAAAAASSSLQLNDPLALSSYQPTTNLATSTLSNSLITELAQQFSTTDTSSIPGMPGIDYPIFGSVPLTSFSCQKQRYKGFFADVETRCQSWHFCDFSNGQSTFICPNGTLFSQVLLTCDWYFNVDCSQAEQLYVLNESLYKYIKPPIPKFPEDFHGSAVDMWLLEQLKAGILPKMKKKSKNKLVING